jgi:hypothetical protein
MAMIIGSGITIGGGITFSQALASGLITNGLLFNLDMQNYVSGTTWPDSSGNNNNFTFYQAPTGSSYGTVYNTGTNQAYWSSPGNNGAVAASAIFPANTDYSKGIVFQFTASTFFNLIGSGPSSSGETFWGSGSTTLQAGNNNGDGYGVVQANATLSANTWYYASLSFSGTTGWTIYINGVAHGTSASTTNRSSASTPEIFAYQGNSNNTTGKVAVAHIYTRALSAAEHLQNATYYLTRYNGSSPA